MIKIENTEVFNFKGALRGLRNPMNSWHLSDSKYGTILDSYDDEAFEEVVSTYEPYPDNCKNFITIEEKRSEIANWLSENGINYNDNHIYSYNYLGKKDLELAQRMINGGTDESKFMRQIFVSFDLIAPLYFLKEFDTYKVGTVANSCSTMHKIHEKEFTLEDFSCERLVNALPTKVKGASHTTNYDYLVMLEQTIHALNFAREMFLETKDKTYWWQMIQLLPSSYNQKRTITLNYQVLRAIYFARRHHKLDEWHDFCNWIENLPYAKELICYKKENK